VFPALRLYGCDLSRFAVRVPNWHRTATTPAMGTVVGFARLGSRDLAHGVVEGQTEDLGTEVDGVAGQIALGPTPIGVFDDQTGIGGQAKIARLAFDQLETTILEQWGQRHHPGGADLLARPPGFRGVAGHSLSSSGVG
jgi:hypothetical protein